VTPREQELFNAALSKAHKLEELLRITRKLEHRVDVLGAQEAVLLLRKVEAQL
jgi:hypothetical protein